MNQNLTIAILALFISCKNTKDIYRYPEICSEFKPTNFNIVDERMMLVKANQLQIGYEVIESGIKYSIALNQNKMISFISTIDSNFIIDGLQVGMDYCRIDNKQIVSEKYYSGWGYIIELKNGWNAMFIDSSILSSQTITNQSKIGSFYFESSCH